MMKVLPSTQIVPHWLPNIDVIAKETRNGFWRELEGDSAVICEAANIPSRRAWIAAAVATVKALQNENKLKIELDANARSAAYALWGYIEDVTASNITDDYIERLRNHYIRNLLIAIGIEI